MNEETKFLYRCCYFFMSLTALIVSLFFYGIAHAQPHAPCKEEITRAIPKKACEKAYPDHECLPLPKKYSTDPHFKCVEKVKDGAPIYSEDCPEGNLSHVKKVCDDVGVALEPECYDQEVLCEPIGYEQVTYNAIVEDVEKVQAERAQRAAQAQQAQERKELRDAVIESLTLDDDGNPLTQKQVRDMIKDMRGGGNSGNREK